MRTKVDKQISSFKVRIDYSKKFPVQDVPTPPHYQKNFLCRFGWFRTMKKNNKFGVGLRPSTYLGCRKPTPFFFLMKPSLTYNDKGFYLQKTQGEAILPHAIQIRVNNKFLSLKTRPHLHPTCKIWGQFVNWELSYGQIHIQKWALLSPFFGCFFHPLEKKMK